MAFIKAIVRDDREVKGLHPSVVECKYLIGERDGRRILQLNTYGSEEREIPGKLSQTLQFDQSAAKDLWTLLKREFDFAEET